MAQQDELQEPSYPTGRGYGHDYMRGGEVLGGYGYSQRPEYETRRGELGQSARTPSTPDGLEHRRPGSGTPRTSEQS